MTADLWCDTTDIQYGKPAFCFSDHFLVSTQLLHLYPPCHNKSLVVFSSFESLHQNQPFCLASLTLNIKNSVMHIVAHCSNSSIVHTENGCDSMLVLESILEEANSCIQFNACATMTSYAWLKLLMLHQLLWACQVCSLDPYRSFSPGPCC